MQAIYDDMWRSAYPKIQQGNYTIDPCLSGQEDRRRGMTVLSYLSQSTKLCNTISQFLDEIKSLEPEQYYYPVSDLHQTVLGIITCVDDFLLAGNERTAYCDVVRQALANIPEFTIRYQGITLSDSCVILQGFIDSDALEETRQSLRKAFGEATLHSTMDARYPIVTAHSTIIRFKQTLRNEQKLLDLLERYRSFYFGDLKVSELVLVTNDWYQKKENTEVLAHIPLQPVIGL